MIRHFKPQRIIEIGSGFSTYLIAQGILKNMEENNHHECNFSVIDPYPNDVIKQGFPGLSEILTKKVQDIPLSYFNKLKKNDILFIDSSHVLKIGGDVQYEYCEILPRINTGVIVQIHDIFLPKEYPQEWIFNEHLFWAEQYLLQAFLTFNNNFEVLFGAHYIHLEHPQKLEEAFDSYNREENKPASFWIKKKK